MFLTTAVTFLLITAIHAVSVGIAAPTDGDAVAIFALELITVTLHITAILKADNYFHKYHLLCQILKQYFNQEGTG